MKCKKCGKEIKKGNSYFVKKEKNGKIIHAKHIVCLDVVDIPEDIPNK